MTKKIATEKTENNNVDLFKCLFCEGEPEFDQEGFKSHLKDAHGISPGTTGTRTLIHHVDATEWYESQYLWEFQGIEFIQLVRRERSEDDLFRWM